MTFTATPPTKPGFYAWKANEDRPAMSADAIICDGQVLVARIPAAELGGLWCRLVPAEEINLTAVEFWRLGMTDIPLADAWNRSRAKAVAEGKE